MQILCKYAHWSVHTSCQENKLAFVEKYSLFVQIKEESLSKGFNRHGILPQYTVKEMPGNRGQPLKFPHDLAFFHTIFSTIFLLFGTLPDAPACSDQRVIQKIKRK